MFRGLSGQVGSFFLAMLVATSLAFTLAHARADALSISFYTQSAGTTTIVDGGPGDTNVTPGIISFNLPAWGPYSASGDVDTGFSASLTALVGTGGNYLRLTNFTAEALVGNTDLFFVTFSDNVTGSFGPLIGADYLDAQADHATGAPVPAGNDNIMDWQGFVDGETIGALSPGPPPYPNPFVPPSGGPLPYATVTHGPFTMSPISFTNPELKGILSFFLASTGDQLKLPSSAEVGFNTVPEPSTMVLAALGAVGIVISAFRRRVSASGCRASLSNP